MFPSEFFSTVFESDPAGDTSAPEWYVITGYARPGVVRQLDEERAADAALREAILAAGLTPWRVTGMSPSGDHAEPGWGVVASEATVLAWATGWDQRAYFAVRDGVISVVETARPDVRAEVGSWRALSAVSPVGLASESRFLRHAPKCARERAATLRFLGTTDADRVIAFNALLKESDESPYTAADWCEAAAEFQNRLECAGRVSPFEKKFGYLHCCALASASIPAALKPALAQSLAEMWELYGYEG